MSFKPPYPGWRPYCLVCKSSALDRMVAKPFGYQCGCCGNKIKHDLTHHEANESAWNTASHNAASCIQCGEMIEVGEAVYINGLESSCDGCGDPMDPGTKGITL